MKNSYRIINLATNYLLYKEWSLWSKMLGKILLVSGPASSGKTTLVLKVIEKFSNWKTINRKKILQEVFDSESIQLFFFDYLLEASNITGRGIVTLEQLYQITEGEITSSHKIRIKKIKNEITIMQTSECFMDIFLKQTSIAYYDAFKQYIWNGVNVIIDEGLVSTEREYNLFRYFCNYPHTKRMLLFNSMNEILEKCIIRNNKFLALLDQYDDINDFIVSKKKLERDTGNSSSTCRMPKDIIEAHKRYYHFETNPSNNDITLEVITLDTLQPVISRIAGEQLSLMESLIRKGYVINILENLVDIAGELKKIFATAKKLYTTTKTNFEYCIKAPGVFELTELDNVEFLQNLLKDVLEWKDKKDSNCFNYKKEVSFLPLIPQNHYKYLLIDPLPIMKVDLVKEWKIWSKCFGKVFVINGTSSSGKTTLSKYLHKFGINLINQDDVTNDIRFDYLSKFTENMSLAKSFLTSSDIIYIMYGFKIKDMNYTIAEIRVIKALHNEIYAVTKDYNFPTKVELYDQIYNISKKFIFSGQDVVIDIVAKGHDIDILSYVFNYFPMKIGLLYAPLEVNLRQCFQRNDISFEIDQLDYRYPAVIMEQYRKFYKFVPENSISKNEKILGKINKDIIKNILEISVYYEKSLFDSLQHLRIYDDKVSYGTIIELLNREIITLKNTMRLDNSEEVFIVPIAKYDFIIKSSDLVECENNNGDLRLIGDINFVEESVNIVDS